MAQEALAAIGYGDGPGILVFGDSAPALERARGFAERAGCRIAGSALMGSATGLIDRFAGPDPILVEFEHGDEPDEAAALLDRLRSEAAARGRRSVVVAAPALTDLVAARAWHEAIEHQCAPTPVERVAAIMSAIRLRPARLRDVGRESSALLQQLSEEVGRIANILASISEEGEKRGDAATATAPAEEEEAPPIPAGFVRSIIRARRLRDQYFRPDLFADPAWDMLLDLMAARLEGNRVAVSSLCIAAAVPATTALRWIKALTDRGLFVRSADPEDGRRVYIELAPDAARSLAAYLRAVQRLSSVAI